MLIKFKEEREKRKSQPALPPPSAPGGAVPAPRGSDHRPRDDFRDRDRDRERDRGYERHSSSRYEYVMSDCLCFLKLANCPRACSDRRRDRDRSRSPGRRRY